MSASQWNGYADHRCSAACVGGYATVMRCAELSPICVSEGRVGSRQLDE